MSYVNHIWLLILFVVFRIRRKNFSLRSSSGSNFEFLHFNLPTNQNESTSIRLISALTSPRMGEVCSQKRRKLGTVSTVFQDTTSDLRSDMYRPSDVRSQNLEKLSKINDKLPYKNPSLEPGKLGKIIHLENLLCCWVSGKHSKQPIWASSPQIMIMSGARRRSEAHTHWITDRPLTWGSKIENCN